MQCTQVVELGFRTGVSTSAFLAGGAHVRSYDIDARCKPHVRRLAHEYPDTFSFKLGDSREVEIPECDLLFIDTDHTEATTLTELVRHVNKVKNWIVLHDTETFGKKDRPPGNGRGIQAAIETFLDMDGHWFYQMLHLPNCNGLTILRQGDE